MSTEDKLIVFTVLAVLAVVTAMIVDISESREDAKVEKRCEAACSPMAYTGFHDEGGCWCHVEDPNTLKRGK